MEIEFDPAKDRINVRNHGMSLKRAEDFDLNAAAIELDVREDYGEERFQALGFLDGSLHSLTFTVRGPLLRAISLRKANQREEASYEEAY